MAEFVNVLRASARPGMRVVFGSEVLSAFLAGGYSLGRWLDDTEVDFDERLYARTVFGKAPTLEEYLEEMDIDVLAEAVVFDQSVRGFQVAATCDSATVSLGNAPWTRDPIPVRLQRLAGNDANFEEEVVETPNLYSQQSSEARCGWLDNRVLRGFPNGGVLFEKATIDFSPVIEFTNTAERQLRALRGSEIVFPHVIRHVIALGQCAQGWSARGGAFADGLDLRCSDESNTTINKYGHERVFILRSGERKMFRWHSKIGPQGWRVHFAADDVTKRVIIGYIGEHLSTASES
ncbi:hypothetical protein [Enhygromyxa salina]|uniref:hypothetical protein n=1 Tax=Enhygromyxa salina TaxID=215803 RepID=UPI0011BA8BF2|nr:hypothetical protein [Enhygromyxa salina]